MLYPDSVRSAVFICVCFFFYSDRERCLIFYRSHHTLTVAQQCNVFQLLLIVAITAAAAAATVGTPIMIIDDNTNY